MATTVNARDITITSLETITAYSIDGTQYRWTLDELQNATISNTEEQTDVTGKQGRLLSSIKTNKSVTVSGTNGLISSGLLESQTGNRMESGVATVRFTDYLTVENNGATTSYKAVGTAGNEILAVYVQTQNMLGQHLTQDAAVGDGKFTYDPSTKKIAFKTGEIDDGSTILVFYDRKIEANVLHNMTDKYAEKVQMYLDAFGEDKCGNVFRVQFYFPKVEFNGNFDIEFGDNQAVHAFEARVMAGACTVGGAMWTYTIFGADTPDVA